MITTVHCNLYEQLTYLVFIVLPGIVEFIIRPGVAGAVLQRASSLIN